MTNDQLKHQTESRDGRETTLHFRFPSDPDTTERLRHLGENRDHWVRRLLVRLANWLRNL